MTLDEMRAFVAVAASGSVNRAAIRLGLTQPAVSRRVQRLERSLGAPLLDRHSKPPALTPAGRRTLEDCRRVLAAVDDMESRASAGGEPAGDLRLGVSYAAHERLLTRALDALRRSFPKVRPHIAAGWSKTLTEAVERGEMDGAVVLTPEGAPPPGLAGRPAGADEIVVVAPKSQGPRRPLTLAELGARQWVLNPEGCGYRAALGRALESARQPLAVAAEVFGPELQLSLVAQGIGWGLAPKRMLAGSPHAKGLATVPVAGFAFRVAFWVLRSPRLGVLSAAVDRFEEELRNSLSPA
jgi:DNA-binding transcriptional LysR family regulator